MDNDSIIEILRSDSEINSIWYGFIFNNKKYFVVSPCDQVITQDKETCIATVDEHGDIIKRKVLEPGFLEALEKTKFFIDMKPEQFGRI